MTYYYQYSVPLLVAIPQTALYPDIPPLSDPGMKVLYKTFPSGMLTGSIPKTCLPSPPTSARKGSGKRSAPPPTSPSVPGPLKDTFTDDGG